MVLYCSLLTFDLLSLRPTLESREKYGKEMAKLAETTRVHIRNVRETALKSIRASDKKFDKNGSDAKKVLKTPL